MNERPTCAALALALLALASSCASTPAYTVESALGPVRIEGPARAEDPELAQHVARAAEAARAELDTWLPDLRSRQIEFLVQDRLDVGGGIEVQAEDGGLTWTRGDTVRVHLRRDEIEGVLVHELVHASLGESWKTLSPALEEGLCELASLRDGGRPDWRRGLLRAAARTGPVPVELSWTEEVQGGRRRHSARWMAAGGLDGTGARRSAAEVLELSELRTLDGRSRDHAYGVGYVCAERVVARTGVAGLHALCVRAAAEGRARVPARQVLAAAGFDSGGELETWAATELSLARVQMILELDSFWELVEGLRERHGGSLERALAASRPRLSISGAASAPLSELPGFRAAAAARWSL